VQERYPRNPLVDMGLLVIRHHHERWDGTGYPEGLEGEATPLAGRLMAWWTCTTPALPPVLQNPP
jgi:response regulator RpfG family c-di-GMP phosphodiesterase